MLLFFKYIKHLNFQCWFVFYCLLIYKHYRKGTTYYTLFKKFAQFIHENNEEKEQFSSNVGTHKLTPKNIWLPPN